MKRAGSIFGMGLVSFGLGVVAMGCSSEPLGPDPEAYTLPDEQTMAEESLYMRQVFEDAGADQGRGFIRLDLSDVKQYRFLVHRFLASGNVPENAPRLFRGVERARENHLARRLAHASSDGIGTAQQALTDERCALFLEAPVAGSVTQSTMQSKSHGNCFGGQTFPYAYSDNVTYRTNEQRTYMVALGSNYVESYDGAADFETPATTGAVPTGTGEFHLTDGIAFVEADNGDQYITYASFAAKAVKVSPSIDVVHPRTFNGNDDIIRGCIKRAAWAGNGDCEYAGVDAAGLPSQNAVGMAKMTYINGNWRADPANANRWFPSPGFKQNTNLYVPLAGTFDVGTDDNNQACTINSYRRATATMTLKSGGWCINGQNNATSAELYNSIQNQKGARYAAFNALADFGTDCLALATANTVPVKVALQIVADTSCGERSRSERIVKDLDFKNSCFAKGTGILRSDGKYVAVEELQMGDKVLSSERGRMLTVVSMARGGEDHPLVHLIDDKGHDVLLTETHPVVTTAGVLVAAEVTPGMTVETESGIATIIDVSRKEYGDMVYNITLGTPQELATIGPNERTMFAGGIRVGDNEMQAAGQKLHTSGRGEVAAEWRADYNHDIARKANLYSVR